MHLAFARLYPPLEQLLGVYRGVRAVMYQEPEELPPALEVPVPTSKHSRTHSNQHRTRSRLRKREQVSRQPSFKNLLRLENPLSGGN